MKVKVIIPASGTGERFGSTTPKQFLKINGKEIIVHAIEKFNGIKAVDEIIISTMPEYFVQLASLIKKHRLKKVKKIVEGGALRQDSVYNALLYSESAKDDIILIHDSVRPFISSKKISEIIKEAKKVNCVILGMLISETIKRIDNKNIVVETIDRKNVWSVQTPQAFRFDILKRSFEKAFKENFTGTDESAIAENAGYKVKVISGEINNIKITIKKDLDAARLIIQKLDGIS